MHVLIKFQFLRHDSLEFVWYIFSLVFLPCFDTPEIAPIRSDTTESRNSFKFTLLGNRDLKMIYEFNQNIRSTISLNYDLFRKIFWQTYRHSPSDDYSH